MNQFQPQPDSNSEPTAVTNTSWAAQSQGLLELLANPNEHGWPGLRPAHLLDSLEGALLRWLMVHSAPQSDFKAFVDAFALGARTCTHADQLGINSAPPAHTSLHARRVHQRAMQVSNESLYQHLIRMAQCLDVAGVAAAIAAGLSAYGATQGVGTTLCLDMAWRLSDAMEQSVPTNIKHYFDQPRSHS